MKAVRNGCPDVGLSDSLENGEDDNATRVDSEGEYVTVPQLAKKLHLSPKTIYNWIRFGDIGEADGIFDVHGRMLIHWPTFRKRHFKPLRRPSGAL